MGQSAVAALWRFKITAAHLIRNLASDLYKDAGACLWELIRNGCVACMPQGRWDPKAVRIDVDLVPDHPLSPRGLALIILDHGTGFTAPRVEEFCMVGPALNAATSHSGAADKKQGRFAGLSLNEKTATDPNEGFYILTRTSGDGKVTFVPMIPAKIEQDQGVQPKEIDSNAAEMGPLKGIKGSFTAIVIPNSEFKTNEEIRKAIQWYLPRKKDLMIDLRIGGKRVNAPSLASKAIYVPSTPEIRIEAYMDRFEGKDPEQNAGLWFADAETGLRVAFCPHFGAALPYPLYTHKLIGDIFVPDLLKNQDAARAALKSSFLKSEAWRNVLRYLALHIAPLAKDLLGDEDEFRSSNSTDKLVFQLADLCKNIYGEPQEKGLPYDVVHDVGVKPKGPSGGGGGGGNGKGPGGGVQKPPKPGGGGCGVHTRPRFVTLRVGKKIYSIIKTQMSPNRFANCVVAQQSPGLLTVYVNTDYKAWPVRPNEQLEHLIVRFLEAISRKEFSEQSEQDQFVSEHSVELRPTRKK